MKLFLASLLSLVAVTAPLFAHAHASPVEYDPGSSANVAQGPSEVRIRFSERLEPGASRMSVADEAGTRVSGASFVDDENPYVLIAPMSEASDGAYLVSWSVVSSDDGHFTKGGYTYVVGEGRAATASAQSQVVQLSALPEATAMAVELAGNSFLLGALFFLLFVLAPMRKRMNDEEQTTAGTRICALFLLGLLLVFGGGGAHIVLKTFELASLHGITLAEAIPLYLGTVSGSATAGRMIAVLIFGVIVIVARKQFTSLRTPRLTIIALLILLAVFAYLRSKVSHATANPFFPELSVTVNFLHLIGKDAWFGLLTAASSLYLVRALRVHMPEVLKRTFRVSALLFALVAGTGAYIVWLHLKEFSNISSTLWGERFMPLAVSALLASALLTYQALASRRTPSLFRKLLPYTLSAEVFAGALIVFFSALMIITSPPLPSVHGTVYHSNDNGVRMQLERAPYEDDQALLSITGGKVTGEPTLLLDVGEDGGTSIVAEKRFEGGYVFPLALLGTTEHALSVSLRQEGAYDARALFQISREGLAGEKTETEQVSYGIVYTLIMIACGVVGILFGIFLFVYMKEETFDVQGSLKWWHVLVGGAVVIVVVGQLAGAGSWLLGNSYKRECVADGNAWHLMLPMQNSIPTSETPQEGCMALNGTFHIPDAREYRFLKNPGDLTIDFQNDLDSIPAGVPVTLRFSFKNQNDDPALLSMVHERLVHMIIIRADMEYFQHVHPEGADTVESAQAKSSEFSLPFTFPTPGTYLLAIDYAHGLLPGSKQFLVRVGNPVTAAPATYKSKGTFDGYDVSFEQGFLVAGTPATILYRITKDGNDVTDLAPYLAAAMHVAVVKNDLSSFVHTHGEVHVPGASVPTATSSTVHNHAPPPAAFGPVIEAHPIFPTPGLYTVFGEFFHSGKVITTHFTARVE